jgi:hypothetical protein
MAVRKKKETIEGQPEPAAVLNVITPAQQLFIEGLLCCKSLTQSARRAGVSKRAAIYWMNDPKHPVRIEYEKQCEIMRETFRTRIVGLHELALSALEDLLSPGAPPSVRFAAARMIYEAHLQPLSNVEQPPPPDSLVESEVERLFDPLAPSHRNQIYLYDDRNRERIPED